MKKVLCVFGTRPEAIKMAPLVSELKKNKNLKTIVCVTAQHRDMLDSVLKIFNISPDFDLNIMKTDQSLEYITTKVISKITDIMQKLKPDLVLVHGDTTTAMATSIAAFYQHIKVGHVEAGLRTYNINAPFPEEINRQVIDKISTYLFAPTKLNEKNLKSEGLNKNQKIVVTGNTIIDALKTTVSRTYHNKNLNPADNKRTILVTAHRRENFGLPLQNIANALKQLADDFDDVEIIYPIHPNPVVKNTVKNILSGHKRISLIEPLDVIDFHNFINHSYFVMTDSGGIQEEAPSLNKPVLVLRDETERLEGVKAGTLRLIGTNTNNIYREASRLLTDKNYYNKIAKIKNPYGDGLASKRIVKFITKNI